MDEQLKELRRLATKIIGQKRAHPDDGTGVRQAASEGLLCLLAVKDANKRQCFQVEEMKEETTRSKIALEKADLTLQNLLYEKQYYEKEILSCRNFQSKVKDETVALMPAEECLAALASSTDAQDRDLHAKALTSEHELMKARLLHENRQRKALVKQLDQLKQMKQTLLNNVGAKERVLKDLQAQLKTLADSSKPLASVLAPTANLRNGMNRAADLLPTPLYVIYSQVVAAKDAMSAGCNANISGNVDEAESYARNLASDTLETGKPAPDASPVLSANSKPDSEDLYKAHPLSVVVEVHRESTLNNAANKPPAVAITAHFQYLPALRIVTVHCSNPGDNAVLKGLFPGDDGSSMPLEALSHMSGGTFKYSSSKVERPYKWAQHLAGIDFVPTLPVLACQLGAPEQDAVVGGLDAYRRQQRVLTVVQRLRETKQGDSALMLMHSNMLRNPLPTDMSVYAHSPVSAIMQWEEVAGAGCVVTPPTPVVPKVLRKSTASQLKEGSQPPMSDMMSQLEEGLDEGEVAPNGATPAAEEAEVAGQAMEVEVQEGDVGEAAVEEEGEAAREEGALEAGEEGEGQEDFSAGRSSGGRGQSLRSRLGRKSSSRAARLLLEMEEEEEGVPGPVPVPKPPSRLFRMVLRSSTVEAEVAVRLYAEYPLRPPLIQVKGLKSLPPATVTAMTAALAKGGTSALKTGMAAPAGKELGGAVVNSIAWMEQQANIEALSFVPPHRQNDTLLYQVTHLRLCLDEISSQLSSDAALGVNAKASGAGIDGMSAALAARQRLRGRARQPAPPAVKPEF